MISFGSSAKTSREGLLTGSPVSASGGVDLVVEVRCAEAALESVAEHVLVDGERGVTGLVAVLDHQQVRPDVVGNGRSWYSACPRCPSSRS